MAAGMIQVSGKVGEWIEAEDDDEEREILNLLCKIKNDEYVPGLCYEN